MRRIAVASLVLLLVCGGCATRQAWEGAPAAGQELISREISPDLFPDARPLFVPEIPQPIHLRPCCAFGADLAVQVGELPVPIIKIPNVIGVEDLGPHNYDNGTIAFEKSKPSGSFITRERNGLIYTCRAGFIDTAHFRDWADWTIFLAATIARRLHTGGTIDLSPHGGARRIELKPVDQRLLKNYGLARAVVPLAQWLAVQLSVWHEIATWYGWSSLSAFPERVSAFSPEDIYSNLLGIRTAGVLIYAYSASSESVYNEQMDVALPGLLRQLGAVPHDVGRELVWALDGLWWDSTRRLPDDDLLLRRNFDLDEMLLPWMAPLDEKEAARLAPHCPEIREPIALLNPNRFAGIAFRERATLEIDVDDVLARRMAIAGNRVTTITQEDFPALINEIRKEWERERGPFSSRPERPGT